MIILITAKNFKKYSGTGCPKRAVRGCKLNLLRKKNHRGIRNQKLGKVMKSQVLVI